MNYLLLPASTFEKYLCELVVRIFIGFGLYLLIFYLMANFAIITYESFLNFRFADIIANHQHSISIERFAFADVIQIIRNRDTEVTRMLIITWIAIYLCMFSIRTLFSHFAFVKTVAVIIGAIILHLRLLIRLTEIVNAEYASQLVWTFVSWLVLIAVVSLILAYYTLKRKRI